MSDEDPQYGAPPNPYPQPGSFDQYAAPTPYGASPYGAYSGGPGGFPPEHPSPFAWVISGRVLREIDASPGRYSGREKASAGRIMGMIGTALLVLGVIAVAAAIVLVFAFASGSNDIGPSQPQLHHRGVVNS